MERVLVIDGDPKVNAAFASFFGNLPIEVVTAASLEEGVNGAGGVADLILIDDFEGSVSQEEALKARERNFATLTPVIAITRARLSKEQWSAMGYSDYVRKPLASTQLHESLVRWLPSLSKKGPAPRPAEPEAVA